MRFTVFCCILVVSVLPHPSSQSSVPQHLIAKFVEKYKRDVEAALPHLWREAMEEAEEFKSRRKRDIIYQDETPMPRTRRKIVDHENEGTYVVQNVTRYSPQYFDGITAMDINCQAVDNKTLVFSIEGTEAGRELMLHQLNENTMEQRLLTSVAAPGAESVEVFTIKNITYAFATIHHQPQAAGSTETINTGSLLYQVLHPSEYNWTLAKTQTIHLPYAKSCAVWTGMGTVANEVFLALAPDRVAISATEVSYSVTVPVYRWQGGYFDYVSELPAKNPQSIQHFAMFSFDYLVVANFQDDTGSTCIMSEIFRYNHKESRFVSFQQIPTYGAKDIRHFTFSDAEDRRHEHFLVIANHVERYADGKPQYMTKSMIFKFGTTHFHPVKRIYTNGAQQFLPVRDGARFFLALVDFDELRLFQYNGWTFVETYSHKLGNKHDIYSSPFSVSLRQFNGIDNGKTYFTMASPSGNVANGIFEVTFETRNDYRRLLTSVENWCKGATQKLESVNLLALEERVYDAPKVNDSRVVILGELRFTKPVKIGQLKSQSLRIGRGKNLDHHMYTQLMLAERRFNALMMKLAFVLRFMNEQVVYVNDPHEQSIITPVRFMETLYYNNERLSVQNLTVSGKMNGNDVDYRLQYAIMLNEPQKIKNLEVDNVYSVDAYPTKLNGYPLSDYALVNPVDGKQVFTGSNIFQELSVTKEVQTVGKFADLSFAYPQFLLYNGNQTFPGQTMNLYKCSVAHLYTRMLNGVDCFTMFADAVSLSGGVIKAGKQFSQVAVKVAHVTTINGQDIDALYNNAIYVNGPKAKSQTFAKPVYFEKMEIAELNPANPKISNKYDLNLDFYKVAGQSYTLKELELRNTTYIEDLYVGSQLNNVKVLPNSDRLDLLLKYSDELQIIQNKKLNTVIFEQNVEAEELVDGIYLKGWTNELKIELTETTIPGSINLGWGSILAREGVFVESTFTQDDRDVMHVLHNAAPLDAEKLPGNCRLTFESLRVLGNSDIRGSVNNVHPRDWVINSEKAKGQYITAEKVFEGPVHFVKDVYANKLYGSEDEYKKDFFPVFNSLLLNATNQNITQEMAFAGTFSVDRAFCPNAVLDKVPFENLMMRHGDQTVEVETAFRQDLTVRGDVLVEGNLTVTLINGMQLTEQLKNTLMTEAEVQRVKGEWYFDVLVVTNETQVYGQVAESSVEALYGDVVRADSEFIQLEGVNLTFVRPVKCQRMEYIGLLNSIPSAEWGRQWLLTRSDQTATTKVEFQGIVTANEVQAPSVNKLDVSRLADSLLQTDRNEYVPAASVTFKDAVRAQGGISMPTGAKVNDIDLTRDVLYKYSPESQTVTASKNFTKGITIQGNLTVDKMEGFNLADFSNLMNGKYSKGPSKLIVKGNLKTEQEPNITTSVNGVEFDYLRHSIWMRDDDVVLEYPVKFNQCKLTKGGRLEPSATINGVNITDLYENYASKTRPQTWRGNVTLKTVKSIDTLKTKDLENTGTFNGANLTNFPDTVLRYSGDQTLEADTVTADYLDVDRLEGEGGQVTINNVNVNRDMMTRTGPNIVTAKKIVKCLKAKNLKLSDDTVINGEPLGEWSNNAVTRTGTHDIQGPVSFYALKTTENVVVDGKVDNVTFDRDHVVTLDQDQPIYNQVTLQPRPRPNRPKKPAPVLKAGKGIEFQGKVNGYNLQEQLDRIVDKKEALSNSTEPLYFKAPTVFNAPVIMKDVKVESLFRGEDVPALLGDLRTAFKEVYPFSAVARYSDLLRKTERMILVSQRRAVFMEYFVHTQTIQIVAEYVMVLRQVGYPAIAVGFQKPDGNITENWMSYHSAVDYYQNQIGNRVLFQGEIIGIAEMGLNTFVFAVDPLSSDKPAYAAMEMAKSNSVSNVEIGKTRDKLSKAFLVKSVDVGTAQMRPVISQVIHSYGFIFIISFKIAISEEYETSCMAATMKKKSETDSSCQIFCMNRDDVLEVVQELQLEHPSLMTSTKSPSMDTTLLAILTQSHDSEPEGLLEIWSHSPSTNLKNYTQVQFYKQSCIPVFNVISLDSLTTHDGKTFLAVASGAMSDSTYQGSVFVYRYSTTTGEFQKTQTLSVDHPLDVKLQWLRPSDEVILYVLSESVTNNLQVYKSQGLSGWSRAHQFTSEKGQSLEVNDFTVDGGYRAQVLVKSATQTNIYAAEFMGMNTVIEEELDEQQSYSSVSFKEFYDFDNL